MLYTAIGCIVRNRERMRGWDSGSRALLGLFVRQRYRGELLDIFRPGGGSNQPTLVNGALTRPHKFR